MSPETVAPAGVNPSAGAFLDSVHFYRCLTCSRLMVALKARAFLKRYGLYCPCGGVKVSPSWPVGLEWLRLDVAVYSLRCKVNDWLGRY